MSDPDPLVKLINASGYAFQTGIEHLIRKGSASTRWSVVAVEHPWSHGPAGDSGFIDIILADSRTETRVVIETKRTTKADWVFLAPPRYVSRHPMEARFLSSDIRKDTTAVLQWRNFLGEPECLESQFCCIRGSGENDRGFLEAIAARLAWSTEAVAAEETGLLASGKKDQTITYIPVIVTNAVLSAAAYDPSDVDLSSGRLSKADSSSVEWIKFHKAVSPFSSTFQPAVDLRTKNRASARTTFVVHSDALDRFLQSLAPAERIAG